MYTYYGVYILWNQNGQPTSYRTQTLCNWLTELITTLCTCCGMYIYMYLCYYISSYGSHASHQDNSYTCILYKKNKPNSLYMHYVALSSQFPMSSFEKIIFLLSLLHSFVFLESYHNMFFTIKSTLSFKSSIVHYVYKHLNSIRRQICIYIHVHILMHNTW